MWNSRNKIILTHDGLESRKHVRAIKMATPFQERLISMVDTTFTKCGVEREWDEVVFEDKYTNLRIKYYGEELNDQIKTAKTFLNWYVGADMTPNFDISLVLLKTLGFFNNYDNHSLLMILKDDATGSLTITSGFAGTLERLDISKDTAAASYFSTFGHAIVGVSVGENAPGPSTATGLDISAEATTITQVKEFYTACWVCLESFETHKPDDKTNLTTLKKNVQLLLNYLGYLGLIVSRYAVKTQSSVTTYFARVATKNFNNITGANFSWTTPPPHSRAVQNVVQVFTKGSASFSSYLVTEIKLYKEMLRMEEETSVSLLTAGNLLHFKFNGMLLINVASKLCLLSKITLRQLLEISAYAQFEGSLNRLIDISNKFICKTSAPGQPSFPWCRLIDDKYMASLSAEPNKPLLDLWLTSIADIENNPDVWSLYPWNGNAPKNSLYKVWTNHLERIIEPVTRFT